MRDVLKGIVLFSLVRGVWLIPLVYSIAGYELYPNANHHWPETIGLSSFLGAVTLWLLYDMRRRNRQYDRAKNEAPKLNVGDRLVWERDSGTIIDKGNHHVIVKWEKGGNYPTRINRVWRQND